MNYRMFIFGWFTRQLMWGDYFSEMSSICRQSSILLVLDVHPKVSTLEACWIINGQRLCHISWALGWTNGVFFCRVTQNYWAAPGYHVLYIYSAEASTRLLFEVIVKKVYLHSIIQTLKTLAGVLDKVFSWQ